MQAMATPTLSMKLLVDTQTQRVLFAETNKDCVDFLFQILPLPMATITTMLKNQGMVGMGSLGKLYKSVENLEDSYLQPNQSKSAILKPVVPNPAGSYFPLLLCYDPASTVKKFYCCSHCSFYPDYSINFSDEPTTVCPNCRYRMTNAMTYIPPPPPPVQQGYCNEGGYVKGVVTYMVMDDLEVKPMSTISSITLFTRFKVNDLRCLQEWVVNLGMAEAVKLLKASLQSDQVLTDVFIKGTS